MSTCQEAYAEKYETILDVETTVTHRTNPAKDLMELLKESNRGKDFSQYLPLYRAARENDWRKVKIYVDEHPEWRTIQINEFGNTILQIAVCKEEEETMWLVDDILNSIHHSSQLEEADITGNTALSYAISAGNIKAATKLVEKNEGLLLIKDWNGYTPLHHAARVGHKKAVKFLLSKTIDKATLFTGESGVILLNFLITFKFYGIALRILKHHIQLDENHQIKEEVLRTLALKPREFKSGDTYRNGKVHLSYWNMIKYTVRRINDCIHCRKSRQRQAHELVKLICEKMTALTSEEAYRILKEPLFVASRLGIEELVDEITKAYPGSVAFFDNNNQNIFQVAILYRQECVFKLIQKMDHLKYLLTSNIDINGNNILHLAGKFQPTSWVSGEALQMQQELQWFKAVEKFVIHVRPSLLEAQNQDKQTPREVFTEEHKQLLKDGQEWMKKAAESYSLVAALIITVTFSVAFTVPGGTKSKGVPNYLKEPFFRAFIQSDASALFFSFISALTFLGILTTRYSEEDFLKSLPRKLFFGLSTLYTSLVSMMVAFSLALFMIFSNEELGISVELVVIFVNLIPIFFVLNQFPLLYEISKSTEGFRFHQRNKPFKRFFSYLRNLSSFCRIK